MAPKSRSPSRTTDITMNPSPSPTTTFASLGSDIFSHILHFLPPTDDAKISTVSKDLYRIAISPQKRKQYKQTYDEYYSLHISTYTGKLGSIVYPYVLELFRMAMYDTSRDFIENYNKNINIIKSSITYPTTQEIDEILKSLPKFIASVALQNANLEVFDIIIKNIKIVFPPFEYCIAIDYAIEHDKIKLDVLKEFFANLKQQVRQEFERYTNIVLSALRLDDLSIFEYLIESKMGKINYKILTNLAKKQQFPTIIKIISKPTNYNYTKPEARNFNAYDICAWVAYHGNIELLKFLKENGFKCYTNAIILGKTNIIKDYIVFNMTVVKDNTDIQKNALVLTHKDSYTTIDELYTSILQRHNKYLEDTFAHISTAEDIDALLKLKQEIEELKKLTNANSLTRKTVYEALKKNSCE